MLLVAIICYAIMIKQLLHVFIKAAHVYVQHSLASGR